jgi:hypothetical protein
MHAETAVASTRQFLRTCRDHEGRFSLTRGDQASPYAFCFAVFIQKLVDDEKLDDFDRPSAKAYLEETLRGSRQNRMAAELRRNKPFMQQLCFTLTTFSMLGIRESSWLSDLILELAKDDVPAFLASTAVLDGKAQSGNLAMFQAVMLIHARDRLGADIGSRLDQWVELHLDRMNRNGFWGSGSPYLQFQNGYHQYEIFEYLGVEIPRPETMADFVLALMDEDGHFAPYPGGGGCYDYDATFLVARFGNASQKERLKRTLDTVLREQNTDGGFCESRNVRPLTPPNLAKYLRHVMAGPRMGRPTRLRQCVSILSPKHSMIHTHWSPNPRGWNQSDLWDTYFRVLTIAQIDRALGLFHYSWGTNSYPGIGYFGSEGETGKWNSKGKP